VQPVIYPSQYPMTVVVPPVRNPALPEWAHLLLGIGGLFTFGFFWVIWAIAAIIGSCASGNEYNRAVARYWAEVRAVEGRSVGGAE